VSDQSITLAFAGPADVTPAVTKALLNDFLGFDKEDADGYALPIDREIELIFPLSEELPSGLATVLAWSEYADLPFTAVVDKEAPGGEGIDDAAEVIKATNVNAKIVDMLTHATGEGVLVLLWGEGDDAGDDDTETLMELAQSEGIRVIDLTAGLDDMIFAEEEPEPEPEPEPVVTKRRGRRTAADFSSAPVAVEETPAVEEKPARRGRSRKAEEPLVQDEEPLVDEPVAEEAPAKPARKKRRTKAQIEIDNRADTTAAATKDYHDRLTAAKESAFAGLAAARAEAVEEAGEEAVQAVETDAQIEAKVARTEDEILSNGIIAARPPVFESLDLIKGTLSSVYLYLSMEVETEALLMLDEKVEETPLAEAVREALEALEGIATVTAEAGVDAPKRGRGRPRREPSDDDITAYFEDPDGILRVATRGRPRRGETRVELTEAQVEEKTTAGLVDG
jgi:hypothetical protein